MKLIDKVNFKNKTEKKAFTYSMIIAIIVGQITALIIWLIFKENYFIALFFGSMVGLLFGYSGKK
ncbi:hypothetical protein [Lutibacter sp. B1]|uniref:hypothetical protein n=1 Tax=Lutibacter sp. B1 TaxID=2725996 RepID=UPI001456F732|nr:hypothetical protein [Lutibacter sp. B1]NLP57684.1 hypothetical protein [Lutibacter sp. B1]